jgi:nucleoside-diphosphate-sugar epimerase
VVVGESFHVVSPAALTLRGFAEVAGATWSHIAHSPNSSIAKAVRLLGYRPRYSSTQAVREALDWLAARGRVPAL